MRVHSLPLPTRMRARDLLVIHSYKSPPLWYFYLRAVSNPPDTIRKLYLASALFFPLSVPLYVNRNRLSRLLSSAALIKLPLLPRDTCVDYWDNFESSRIHQDFRFLLYSNNTLLPKILSQKAPENLRRFN